MFFMIFQVLHHLHHGLLWNPQAQKMIPHAMVTRVILVTVLTMQKRREDQSNAQLTWEVTEPWKLCTVCQRHGISRLSPMPFSISSLRRRLDSHAAAMERLYTSPWTQKQKKNSSTWKYVSEFFFHVSVDAAYHPPPPQSKLPTSHFNVTLERNWIKYDQRRNQRRQTWIGLQNTFGQYQPAMA